MQLLKNMRSQQMESLVPNEVLQRDLNVGTATAGGNLVPTELLGRLIH